MEMYFKKEGMNSLAMIPCERALAEGYQDNLFRYHEVPYFLNYEVRQINEKETICYHLKYRTTMKAVMGHLPFTLERLKNMVESIIGAIETAEDYLLDSDCILWKSENVFLEADTGKLQFCYYPVRDENRYSLKDFLMEIMQAVDKKQEEAVLFILQFYNLVTEESCSLEEIREFKNKRLSGEKEEVREYSEPEEPFERLFENKNFYEEEKSEVQKSAKKKLTGDKEKIKESIGCQVIKILLVGTAIFDMIFILCLVFEVLTYGYMKYLFVGLGALIVLTILYMQISKEETPDEMMQNFFEEQKMRSQNNEKERLSFVENKSLYEEKVENLSKGVCRNRDENGAETRLLSDVEETSLLVLEDKEKHLYLRAFDEGRYPDILLEEKSIVVGSMPESCDYVLNVMGVSRMHAKLMPKLDGLYVLDLNSTNGTYLNGEVIESGQDFKLEEGDMIAFARCEFLVVTEV